MTILNHPAHCCHQLLTLTHLPLQRPHLRCPQAFCPSPSCACQSRQSPPVRPAASRELSWHRPALLIQNMFMTCSGHFLPTFALSLRTLLWSCLRLVSASAHQSTLPKKQILMDPASTLQLLASSNLVMKCRSDPGMCIKWLYPKSFACVHAQCEFDMPSFTCLHRSVNPDSMASQHHTPAEHSTRLVRQQLARLQLCPWLLFAWMGLRAPDAQNPARRRSR